jgi:glycosyltransferase involved in cell wall biosynthesis
MAHPGISVTLITLNEERNLPRALASVRWADEVIVVDAGSTDRTVDLARAAGARVEVHPWEGYGQQKNFAQSLARNPWVLSLDADEEVPGELAGEIAQAVTSAEAGGGIRGFKIPRKTWYLGRWILHGGWFPNHVIRLARKDSAHWTTPPVHERLEVKGTVGTLSTPIHHYNFVDITDQVQTNLRYSRLGHQELQRRGRRASLFKLLFKPVGKFLETFVIKRGFMDGIAGFIISINAAHSIFLKYAYFFEEATDANSDHR